MKKPKKANGFFENQTEAKKPDNDKDKDTDTDTEKETDIHVSKMYDENVKKIEDALVKNLGNTNITVFEECFSYLDDLPFEVIEEALKRASRKNKKWDYAKGILKRWSENKLNSLDKIKVNDNEFKTQVKHKRK